MGIEKVNDWLWENLEHLLLIGISLLAFICLLRLTKADNTIARLTAERDSLKVELKKPRRLFPDTLKFTPMKQK